MHKRVHKYASTTAVHELTALHTFQGTGLLEGRAAGQSVKVTVILERKGSLNEQGGFLDNKSLTDRSSLPRAGGPKK